MKLKKLNKISFISILLVMVIILSSGCSKSVTQNNDNKEKASINAKNEQKVITVWAWDDKFNIPVIEKAGEYYNKVNPNVKIKVLSLSKEDVYTKLQTALAAGGGQGLPDVVLLEDYVAGKFLKTFNGAFADLSNDIDYSNFLDFKKQAVTYNGHQYGIPFDTGATSLFYRLDVIEKAGYTENDMKNLTWDKFIEIGKKVKEKTGLYMDAEVSSDPTSTIRTIMQSAGQWYFDKSGNINIKNNKALAEALTVLKKMQDAGILYWAQSAGDRSGAINGGKVAAVVNGPWFVSTLKAAPDQKGLWRVAETPRLSDLNSVNASNVGGGAWYILNSSKNKKEAIDLFKNIFTGNLDFYKDILVNQGALTAYKPALQGDVFQQGDDFFGGQKIYAFFADTLSKVPVVNYGGYVAEANAAINGVLMNYMSGSLSLNDALTQAENQLKNQLGK